MLVLLLFSYIVLNIVYQQPGIIGPVLYALDAATGDTQWTYKPDDGANIVTAGAVDLENNLVYIGTNFLLKNDLLSDALTNYKYDLGFGMGSMYTIPVQCDSGCTLYI